MTSKQAPAENFSFAFSDGEDDVAPISGLPDPASTKRKARHQLYRSAARTNTASTPQLALAEAKRNESLASRYHLTEGLSERPYHRAIVREDVFSVAGKQLSSGDVVEVHWLGSSHFELTVYPVYDYHVELLSPADKNKLSAAIRDGVRLEHQTTISIPPVPINILQLPDPCPVLSLPQLTVGAETTHWQITPKDCRGQADARMVRPKNSASLATQLSSLLNRTTDTHRATGAQADIAIEPDPLDALGTATAALSAPQSPPSPSTSRVAVQFDNTPFSIAPVKVQISNLTFISAPETIALIRSIANNQTKLTPALTASQNQNRHTKFLLELYPFLDLMPYPETHPFPDLPDRETHAGTAEPSSSSTSLLPSAAQTPLPLDLPLHYSSAPLQVDQSLQTWTWPVSSQYFLDRIFAKKCFVVHAGGQRLSQVKKDMAQFKVKTLMESSPSTIIWMKTKPNQAPDVPIGELARDQTMYYIATGPETAFAAYLAGHTIYFNPIDQIQAKYVKSLAIELGGGYGYTPPATSFDDDDGMAHLDEAGSFGGDMEIFAVNTLHTTDWHFDSQHNISIQLLGTKIWSVLPGVEEPVTNYHAKSINKQSVVADRYMHQLSTVPYNQNGVGLDNARKWTNQETHSLNRPQLDHHPDVQHFHVRPGTIFYHPAGTYHKVVADSSVGGSLSLNISLDCLRYSDLIMSTLSQMIMTHPQLRKRVNTNRDDVDAVVRNTLDTVLPQMFQSILGQQSPRTVQPGVPKRLTGLVIPALFTKDQIHDFPLAKVLSMPAHQHHVALSALLYKDHGCINLHQHLAVPADVIPDVFPPSPLAPSSPSSTDKSDADSIPIAHKVFSSRLFSQLVKPNAHVLRFFPQLSRALVSFGPTTIAPQNETGGGHATESISNADAAAQLVATIDAFAETTDLISNTLVALITNEPQYIISRPIAPSQPFVPTSSAANPGPKSVLSIATTGPPQPELQEAVSSASNWPVVTPSSLRSISTCPYLAKLTSCLETMSSKTGTTMTEKESSLTPTASSLDLSTLPLLFVDQRHSASHHLYSICTGFSTHNSTSNHTPSAQNTKVAPQYSIGVLIDAKSLCFAASPHHHHQTPSSGQHDQHPLRGRENHIVLNIVLFVHWALQHGVQFTFPSLIQSAEYVALLGAPFHQEGGLGQLQKLMVRMVVLNLVGLFTHCGIFRL